MPERRRFKRIAFEAQTELRQGDRTWPVKLLDLSLKGFLIEKPQPWEADPAAPFDITLNLSDQAIVEMEGTLAHDEQGHLGFLCTHIDLDSVTHLRRLIEWNLGDPDELERELGALLQA